MVNQSLYQKAQPVVAFLKQAVIILLMAVSTGSACALFLWSLDWATHTRFTHPWMLYLLPVAGLVVGYVYHRIGKSSEGGNNLIIEQIHEPGGGVPRRMAPLILASTVITHLFGGSAGREGTAVQMGGSIASTFARIFKMMSGDVRILLMAGMAAGFGAIFGTPLAGAVFAIEVLVVGQLQYKALIPCLAASFIGDWTCHAWGVGHVSYHVDEVKGTLAPVYYFHFDPVLLIKVLLAAVAFGLAGRLFAVASHRTGDLFKRFCPYAPFRPVIGGVIVIGLVFALGTRQYLGLGVASPNPDDVTIVSLFDTAQVHPWAWWWKLVFTVITLSSGFKGGDVTPLFYIGAALGNTLAGIMGAPFDLFAALGFVAIFAGATKTPLACTIMGLELFGATNAIYLAVACFLACLCSGRSSIYHAQRRATLKGV